MFRFQAPERGLTGVVDFSGGVGLLCAGERQRAAHHRFWRRLSPQDEAPRPCLP